MRQSIRRVTIALTTHGHRTEIFAWGWGRAFDLKMTNNVISYANLIQ